MLRIVGLLAALAACQSEPAAHSAPERVLAPARAASTPPPAAPLSSADADRLLADISWLAADAQEGRRAGTPAGLRAGEWLAERCAQIGLEPAGESGRFTQALSVPMPVEVGLDSSLRWSGGERTGAAVDLDQVMPMFCSGSGAAQGALEWRGYGIIDAEKSWNDYATRCDGKVVLIVRGTPPAPPASEPAAATENAHGGNVQAGDGWGNSGSLFLKVMNAKKNGAVAVLVAPHPAQAGEPLPAFDFGRAAQAGIPALFVSARVVEQLYPEWRAAVEASDRQGGAAAPAAAPALAVELNADVRRGKGPATNVLALLRGRSSERVIVVGAHYDHLGHGGEGSLAPNAHGEIHNGADDNASGTAAVLEIARLLKVGPAPDCDVLIALWSGEELGLLGSEHWGTHPTVALERVAANLNLDMVGRANSGSVAVIGAGSAAPFDAWLREAGASVALELKISASGQGIGGSDHQTFLKRKIPALHFFTGVHADYHKPTDDIERIEADGTAKVVALAADVVRRMCASGDLAWTEPPAPTEVASRTPSPFRVWFGTVPDYAFEGPGLRLSGTSAGSPAEKAGLIAGDVLVQVGDVEIESINDFMYALGTYKPGDVVLARYLRDGAEESARVTLATRDAQ